MDFALRLDRNLNSVDAQNKMSRRAEDDLQVFTLRLHFMTKKLHPSSVDGSKNKDLHGDFPGRPVVKPLCFQSGGWGGGSVGLIPGQ